MQFLEFDFPENQPLARAVLVSNISDSNFGFVSDFELRISDFDALMSDS